VRKSRTVSNRIDRGRDQDVGGWLKARLAFLTGIGWGPRDAIACMVGAVGAVAILVNALFLQAGPHPAPLFKAALTPVAASDATNTVVAAVPRARPADPAPAKSETSAIARTPVEIMVEIQRELARRGFYDGAADGLHGPKTDSAIRDFEQAAGLKPSQQPNEALLQAIVKSSIQAPKPASAPPAAAPAPARSDAIADMISSSRRVMALQRALALYGYGQIKPTGVVDGDTHAAIEKFERERKLPVTGQPSERVARELTGLTGRPLD
jgi:peptidoglycan hydrolase-like protein with peptidoglycan-binding domain